MVVAPNRIRSGQVLFWDLLCEFSRLHLCLIFLLLAWPFEADNLFHAATDTKNDSEEKSKPVA